MKAREFLYGLGFRPRTKEYSFDIDTFVLPRDGEISFARWRHPKESKTEFSQAAIDAIRDFVQSGDVAIDIGAHTGDTTLPIALAAGPKGTVFALEPNRYVFKILEVNASLNQQKTRIVPLMFAATPRDGEFEFEYSDSGFCNGGLHQGMSRWRHANFFKQRVMGRNLVDYLKREFPDAVRRIRYIKIDTEGSDRNVAVSLKPLLIENRPFIRSEIYQHLSATERRGYYADLRELGYRVHKFNSKEDYFGEELDQQQMLQWKHFDIFAVPV